MVYFAMACEIHEYMLCAHGESKPQSHAGSKSQKGVGEQQCVLDVHVLHP